MRGPGLAGAVVRVIDVHVHLQPYSMVRPECLAVMQRNRPEFPHLVEMTKNPNFLIKVLDDAKVDRAGLINYVAPETLGFTPAVNDFIAAYTKEHRDRVWPYGGIDPKATPEVDKEMDRILGLGIRALKIHPPHQLFFPNDHQGRLPALGKIYRRCEEEKVPIVFHTGTSIFPGARNKFGDPMAIDDVAVDYPDLKIVMAHGGRPIWMETCFFLVRRHRNVFMDVSGVPPQSLLNYFPRLAQIAEKTMFGTDWPGPGVPDIRGNIDRFLALELGQEATEAILWGTARRVFTS